jgi:hypothetical protein
VDVENDDIQKSRQENQAQCPCQKVFESVALKQIIMPVRNVSENCIIIRAEQICLPIHP